jgi:photosystem II stability/assembly factor-like uncharacterized protein
MTLHTTRIRSFAVAALFVMLLAVPATARAADSLSWAVAFAGPADIPKPGYEPIPVASALNSISFGDATHAWAVGVRVDDVALGLGTRSSLVAYTADGGATWSDSTAGVAVELYAVSAVSASEAWAVGDSGTIVHFSSGSWTVQTVAGWPTSKAFRGVAFVDSLHGWAVGDGGGVVYTANGGTTWTIITAPGTASALRGVTVVGTTGAIAVGDAGSMRYLTATTNSARGSGTGENLYGVTLSDAGHAWAVGENATVVRSIDGGASWAVATRTLPGGFALADLTMRSVAFSGPYTGVIVGTYQMVWRTSDGGTTWTPLKLYDGSWLGDFELRSAGFAGSSAAPVCVARPYGGALDSRDNKARAYRGAWTGITPQPPFAPTGLGLADGGAPKPRIALTWTDHSYDEDGFVVERAQGSAPGTFVQVASLAADTTSWTDASANWSSTWFYRVRSFRGGLSSTWAVSTGFAVDAIAPTTTSNATDSYTESATIAFSAQDNAGGSGIAHVWSTVDGSDLRDGVSRTLTGTGSHTVRFWSQDVAGNTEAANVFVLSIADPLVIAPLAPSAVVAADGGAPRPRITVTWTDNSSDEDGFVVQRSHSSAPGAFSTAATLGVGVTSWTDTGADWASTWRYRVRSFRGAAWSTWVASGPFAVDAIVPVTTSDASDFSYVESATITFTATDNAGGSGVAHVWSTIDGSGLLDGASRVVAGFGPHTLAFWSEDVAGNIETVNVVPVLITDPSIPDTTAPVTISNAVAYYNDTATIVLQASDPVGGSGVKATYYTLNGGSPVASVSLNVVTAGAYTLRFWSVDASENVESTHTVTFTVVATPASNGTPSQPILPTTTITHGKSFTVYGFVTRHTSGTSPIRLYFYKYKSGHWVYYKYTYAKVNNFFGFSRYLDSTSVPSAGMWRVRARMIDGRHSHYGYYKSFTVK